MEIKLLLKEKDKRIVVDNFRTGTLLAQGGAPRGPKGDQGVSVTGVELISVAGVNKTYRMHFSDSSYFDFVVKDGAEGLWGYIEGELANQSDLVSALNSKANVADLATVATTGDYEDLLNQPTIPTDTEDLTNGAGYQTASEVDNAIDNAISTKANTDLGNVSATGKNTATGWMMPDYSAMVSGLSFPYTAPKNGLLSFNSDETNGVLTISGYSLSLAGNDVSNEGPVQILVSKDDVISFSPANYFNLTFIPMKGAN